MSEPGDISAVLTVVLVALLIVIPVTVILRVFSGAY